jgi:hypothetical protein
MTREEALKNYNETEKYFLFKQLKDIDYILRRLQIPISDWENKIIGGPNKTEDDYSSNKSLISLIKKIISIFK